MKNIEVVKLHKNKVVIINYEKKKFLIINNSHWDLVNKSYELIDGKKLEFIPNETISKMVNFNLSSNPIEDMYLKLNYILNEYGLKILDDNDLELNLISSKDSYTFKIVPISTSKVSKKYKFKANVDYYTSLKNNLKEAKVEQVEDISFYPFIINLNDKDNFISSPLLEMEDYEFDYHIRKGTLLGELLDFDYKKSKEIFEKVKYFINNNYKFNKTQNFHKKWITTILFKDEV
jgi:hypothetical protein